MNCHRLCFVLCHWAAVWLGIGTAAHAVVYNIQVLDSFAGAEPGGSVFSINELGTAAGFSSLADGSSRATRWDATVPTNLGQIAPTGSVARAINDAGQVVGRSAASGEITAFLWESGVFTNLGAGNLSSAFAINSAGVVVGRHEPAQLGFVWENGSLTTLPALPGGSFSNALGINDAGRVVGIAGAPLSQGRAVVWDNGVPTNLGLLSGSSGTSIARDINAFDQIVGSSTISSGGGLAVLWEGGGVTALGTLESGGSSNAFAINDSGHVVGNAFDSAGNNQRAFVYLDGQINDLNNLIPSGSGWDRLRIALDINNAGQIVGRGVYQGLETSFLLTPVPEPRAFALALMGLVALLSCNLVGASGRRGVVNRLRRARA